MRIAVIGAGVVGVTTAYELAAAGHETVVFERRQSVAEETSFANGGIVAPGQIAPWTAPGMPNRVLRQLLERHVAWRVRPGVDREIWRWLRQWRLACEPARHAQHRSALHRLARYSQECLHEIRRQHRLEYERTEGYLVLLREEEDVALAQPGLELLKQLDVPVELLDARQCREHEPELHAETPLAAGLRVPGDEAGNCRQFTFLLRDEAARLGVDFQFDTEVLAIRPEQRPLLLLRHQDGPVGRRAPVARQAAIAQRQQQFDAVVVCAAAPSLHLLSPLGLRLPLLPVYGYSVSAPLRGAERGPRSAVMDERYKVVVSRLGQRVRVAGGAELGGIAGRHTSAMLDTLYKVLHDWFPGAAQLPAQVWQGARPMLPDGPPLIGPSGVPGVWLNLGHGPSGWALACGSARLLAQQIDGRPPAVDAAPFSIGRLQPA